MTVSLLTEAKLEDDPPRMGTTGQLSFYSHITLAYLGQSREFGRHPPAWRTETMCSWDALALNEEEGGS